MIVVQDAFKLFGRPQDGITPAMFRDVLYNLGIELLPAELQGLFDRYDKDCERPPR
jgi:Ca2+-binding EF-hand superfamily protein